MGKKQENCVYVCTRIIYWIYARKPLANINTEQTTTTTRGVVGREGEGSEYYQSVFMLAYFADTRKKRMPAAVSILCLCLPVSPPAFKSLLLRCISIIIFSTLFLSSSFTCVSICMRLYFREKKNWIFASNALNIWMDIQQPKNIASFLILLVLRFSLLLLGLFGVVVDSSWCCCYCYYCWPLKYISYPHIPVYIYVLLLSFLRADPGYIVSSHMVFSNTNKLKLKKNTASRYRNNNWSV